MPTPKSSPYKTLQNSIERDSNGAVGMEDSDGICKIIAHFMEELQSHILSPPEKELATKRLLDIAKSKKDARIAIATHSQAIALLVALLRSGNTATKSNAALILSALCKEQDLQVRVLLGGCIPPLLSLLKSESAQAQRAAAEAIYAVSYGGVSDHVGLRIFATEGVVPRLWNQLHNMKKQEKSIEDLLTGTLKNLCTNSEDFWKATIESGGVEILIRIISSGSAASRANASSLLASLMQVSDTSCAKVLNAGAVQHLLKLLGPQNEDSVRAEAAGALCALSSKSSDARKAIVDGGGIPSLIASVVAPSKEFMEGKCGQALSDYAMGSLANISGGMSALVHSLGQNFQTFRSEAQVGDIIGALAYALMSFAENSDPSGSVDSRKIENLLVRQLNANISQLVQERSIEALASLYGNAYLSVGLLHGEAKKLLVGLVTLTTTNVRKDLIQLLKSLCTSGAELWQSFNGKEGIQLLISFLGLTTEQQQEYAAAILSILSVEASDSKWAITAAGGIPPLVQLLEIGSGKAKEDAALILSNLCSHSEEIRACVESAGAIPALLSLLKNGSAKGQEIAAVTLKHLVRDADVAFVNQLISLLFGNKPKSKAHVIVVLGCVLSLASHEALLKKGGTLHKALQSLVQMLSSSKDETQENAASALADFCTARKDICKSLEKLDVIEPLIRLLSSGTESVSLQSARALGALFSSSITRKGDVSIARNAVRPLMDLVKSSNVGIAEMAVTAISSLLIDGQIAEQALLEDIIPSLTRVLRDGTRLGKRHSATALNRLLSQIHVDDFIIESICQLGTVTALVGVLDSTEADDPALSDALEALAILSRVKQDVGSGAFPWDVIVESPCSVEPLLNCLVTANPVIQEKAIEVLSRFCRDYPILLGNLVSSTAGCVYAVANQVVCSSSLEVQVGGAAILICAAREHKQTTLCALTESGIISQLMGSLVNMTKAATDSRDIMTGKTKPTCNDSDAFSSQDCASNLGGTVALWLLSFIASHSNEHKRAIMEAGGLDALIDRLLIISSKAVDHVDVENHGGTWVCALLLAILFQEPEVIRHSATMRVIPCLAQLLKSDDSIERYFAAQALASLVSKGNRGTLLAVANSGAPAGLLLSLGCMDSDMSNLATLSEEFDLPSNPDEVVLERLFRVDDINAGSTARKSIPALVELLKPMPERPGAPMLALRLLTQMAVGSDTNRVAMAEAGALEALTKYLSLGTQDAIEEAAADLLRILFGSPDLRYHHAAFGAARQLIAVLRLGSKGARYSAVRALQYLFETESIRSSEMSRQAIQPLVEMLNAGSEREQKAAIGALTVLSKSPPKAVVIAEAELRPLDSLYEILSAPVSMELKEEAALLCSMLFANSKTRATINASECIQPLLQLLHSNSYAVQEASVRALDNLLNDEEQATLVAASGAVVLLVDLLVGTNYVLLESVVSALIKLGKDRSLCKLDMVKAGAIHNVLEILSSAPDSLCALIAELLRILTNNSSISRNAAALRAVEPLFLCLTRPELSVWGQHSSLQVLVNVLEKPQAIDRLQLTPAQAIEPLIVFLESPSQPVQQLGAELLSLLLEREDFRRDIATQHAVSPLVTLVGSGILGIQKMALRALEIASITWPNAVADSGGIMELSKVILQVDPLPPHALWESAALVLSNVLRFSSQYYLKVPVAALVKLLSSSFEQTVVVSLSALIVFESDDASSAELMAEAGCVEALLELLRAHQCEEAAARLLEALFNNIRVREMKVSKFAINPLSQYLLDPQTRAQPARLLATLALGDLFQHEWLARTSDAVTACRALVSLLEDQPSEEMTMVAVCALQNLVMHSRTNRRAVAEAGGILVVQDLLAMHNAEMTAQAALLVKLLFSNHTLQEYVSTELVRSLTAALEKEFWATATINEEVVKAITVLFRNFSRLRGTEAATLCIPHLVCALKAGTEPAQDAALDALCLLKDSWTSIPADSGKAQAMVAAEAIPILQLFMRSGPEHFHERADSLLQYLPGSLTVTIKRGLNLKLSIGSTNAFCKLTLGNGAPRLTKVVSRSSSPEWKQEFAWAFEMPPKGQKLQISCKSKSTFGTVSLGKVTIQIDKVVMLGTINGQYKLVADNNRDGTSRMLEIEFQWSNR